MKSPSLVLLLLAAPAAAQILGGGGDRERGLELYRAGKYAEAAAAFRAALERDGDSAELQYNLALASWRAGDLAAAETAVETYAATTGDARRDLHAGLLGAIRMQEAKALAGKAAEASGQAAAGAAPADPLPLLEQALGKAQAARDHFVRGALGGTTPELRRNLERTLQFASELERRIEELKKQQEQQQQSNDEKDDNQQQNEQQQDEKQDQQKPEPDEKKPEQKPDEQQQDPSEKPQQGEQGEPKPDETGEERPEPGKAGEPPGEPPQGAEKEPKPDEPAPTEQPPAGEQQPEPKPGEEQQQQQQERRDAPGETAEGRELSPEQAQRLMEALKELDQKLKAYRARTKSGRRPVERDW